MNNKVEIIKALRNYDYFRTKDKFLASLAENLAIRNSISTSLSTTFPGFQNRQRYLHIKNEIQPLTTSSATLPIINMKVPVCPNCRYWNYDVMDQECPTCKPPRLMIEEDVKNTNLQFCGDPHCEYRVVHDKMQICSRDHDPRIMEMPPYPGLLVKHHDVDGWREDPNNAPALCDDVRQSTPFSHEGAESNRSGGEASETNEKAESQGMGGEATKTNEGPGSQIKRKKAPATHVEKERPKKR